MKFCVPCLLTKCGPARLSPARRMSIGIMTKVSGWKLYNVTKNSFVQNDEKKRELKALFFRFCFYRRTENLRSPLLIARRPKAESVHWEPPLGWSFRMNPSEPWLPLPLQRSRGRRIFNVPAKAAASGTSEGGSLPFPLGQLYYTIG